MSAATVAKIQSEFDVGTRRAKRVATLFDQANQSSVSMPVFGPRLRGVALDPRGKDYYLIEELGRGGFGAVWSASTDASQTSEYAVKQFRLDKSQVLEPPPLDISLTEHDEYEFRVEYVEQEYRIAAVIRRRLGEAFCRDNAVCAEARFYSLNQRYGYIVFPYVQGEPLSQYIGSVLYGRRIEYLRRLKLAGIDAASSDELLSIVENRDEPRMHARLVTDALDQLLDTRLYCMELAGQLLRTLALLHRVGIIHGDVKPANMLVVRGIDSVRLRLIDFGLGCAFSVPTDVLFQVREKDILECIGKYRTTRMYEDPLAHLIEPRNPASRRDFFKKFDTYSAGKVLTLLFNPTYFDALGREQYEFPEVRQTTLMPPAIYALAQAMTDEREYKPVDPSRPLELTPAERKRREQAIADRISIEEALDMYDAAMAELATDIRRLEAAMIRLSK